VSVEVDERGRGSRHAPPDLRACEGRARVNRHCSPDQRQVRRRASLLGANAARLGAMKDGANSR
jgi:hypothetical protein